MLPDIAAALIVAMLLEMRIHMHNTRSDLKKLRKDFDNHKQEGSGAHPRTSTQTTLERKPFHF